MRCYEVLCDNSHDACLDLMYCSINTAVCGKYTSSMLDDMLVVMQYLFYSFVYLLFSLNKMKLIVND